MATYDRAKLIRIMERRSAHFLMKRSYFDRYDAARESASKARVNIAIAISSRGLPVDHSEKLFAMSTEEKQKLSRQDVETYKVRGAGEGAAPVSYYSGINYENFQAYVKHQARAEALYEMYEALGDGAEFSVVNPLIEAVKSWGFSDPSKEV